MIKIASIFVVQIIDILASMFLMHSALSNISHNYSEKILCNAIE